MINSITIYSRQEGEETLAYVRSYRSLNVDQHTTCNHTL